MQTLSLAEIDAVSGAITWGDVTKYAEMGSVVGTVVAVIPIPGAAVVGGSIIIASGVAYTAAAVFG